ncbi:hypothetical protein GCM10011584_11200 [Nocardioides phosphati]|uniref:SRPBCC family protein n=1 Tax=Nocardioides phosphati TaxID=1867775 RepID=A0ABQ2N7Z8_9ACTN|nr:SRPBCC family protein [Nocardioides phosphati]GGO87188.1 hypothetical protein GCM10011584_11200 [Nocardioides phosphati]
MTGHVIHLNTEINASPEAVWDVLTDVAHYPEILRSVKATRVGDEPYDVGTSWVEERTFFGHHGEEELRVTECVEPRRTTHETRVDHDSIRSAYVLQPHGDGSTKLLVTATLDITDRTSTERMLWNAFGAHSYNATRKMLEHDLEDIRTEAERRGAQTGGAHRAS